MATGNEIGECVDAPAVSLEADPSRERAGLSLSWTPERFFGNCDSRMRVRPEFDGYVCWDMIPEGCRHETDSKEKRDD